MDKFSKLKPKKVETKSKEVLFSGDWVKVIKWKECEIIDGKDSVFCIPYFIEDNEILIRKEFVPAYKIRDGLDYVISIVGGGIEGEETPEEALLREVQEETGIVLRSNYKVELDGPYFITKSSTQKIWFAILPITKNDYYQIKIKGDGSEIEKMSDTIKLSVQKIKHLKKSDIITELMIQKFFRYLNI